MSITLRSKRSADLLRTFVLILPGLLLFGISARAQTIELKILDGRNGHPVADRCMYVWVGDRSNPNSGPLLETQTDKDGIISLKLTHTGGEMNDQGHQLACGLAGSINPIAKYGDTISIRSGYASCQPHTPDYSWLARADFSTDEVLQHGIATANACGKIRASPKPGEVILFVRPLTWQEKLKQ